MNFDDTPNQASFRAEARGWIQTHAPTALRAELALAGYGQPPLRSGDVVKASQAWQKKKPGPTPPPPPPPPSMTA